jgi:hypothetical protein
VAEDFTDHAKAEAAFVGMLGRVRADVNWCLNGFNGFQRIGASTDNGRLINGQDDLLERLLRCQLPHPPHDPDGECED